MILDHEKAKDAVLRVMSGKVSTATATRVVLALKEAAIEAAPVNNNPCGFCGKFNFGDAKAEVYSHGANIVLASALARFPVEEQFNFCPVCGRRVKKGGVSND